MKQDVLDLIERAFNINNEIKISTKYILPYVRYLELFRMLKGFYYVFDVFTDTGKIAHGWVQLNVCYSLEQWN